MEVIDYSRDEDQRALEMHAATEAHVKALRITYGVSRKDALEHLVAFSENDEEAPLTPVAPIKLRAPRKRPRRVQAEAAA